MRPSTPNHHRTGDVGEPLGDELATAVATWLAENDPQCFMRSRVRLPWLEDAPGIVASVLMGWKRTADRARRRSAPAEVAAEAELDDDELEEVAA